MQEDATSRLAVDVAEAARLLSISRARCYGLVMSGELASVKIGRRRVVPVEGIRAFLFAASGRESESR